MIISSILVFSLIAGLPSICVQNDTMSMDNYNYDECNIEFVQFNDKRMMSEGGDMGMIPMMEI
jgi:hypothetical protein